MLLKIDFKGIDTEPKLIFAKKQVNRTSIKNTNGVLYVFFLGNY